MHTIYNDQCRPFLVRVVRKGDTYGLRDCLTHDKAEPMIEFYDATGACGDSRGSFVQRYYVSTLEAHPKDRGILLHGSAPDVWRLDAGALQQALRYERASA